MYCICTAVNSNDISLKAQSYNNGLIFTLSALYHVSPLASTKVALSPASASVATCADNGRRNAVGIQPCTVSVVVVRCTLIHCIDSGHKCQVQYGLCEHTFQKHISVTQLSILHAHRVFQWTVAPSSPDRLLRPAALARKTVYSRQ